MPEPHCFTFKLYERNELCPSALARVVPSPINLGPVRAPEPSVMSRSFLSTEAPIKMNFRFAEALAQAVILDDQLRDYNEGMIELPEDASLEDDGRWSPTSLSPLSTPPSSPPPSPQFVPIRLEDLPALLETLDLSPPPSSSLSSPHTDGPPCDSTSTAPAEEPTSAAKKANKRGKRRKPSAAQVEKGKERSRKRKRDDGEVGDGLRFHRHAQAFIERGVKPNALPDDIPVDFDAAQYSVTNGAYTARREDGMKDSPWTLAQLRARRFRRFEWDGW